MIDVGAGDLETVRRILATHVPANEVWAFGSRVHGPTKPWSDLDLAIIADTPLPLEVVGALKEDFAESDLPFRIDIVDWSSTGDAFRRVIERSKEVVQTPRPR